MVIDFSTIIVDNITFTRPYITGLNARHCSEWERLERIVDLNILIYFQAEGSRTYTAPEIQLQFNLDQAENQDGPVLLVLLLILCSISLSISLGNVHD